MGDGHLLEQLWSPCCEEGQLCMQSQRAGGAGVLVRGTVASSLPSAGSWSPHSSLVTPCPVQGVQKDWAER